MGTKAKPGKYDCYEKAYPNEPIFTLRAKDPNASRLVRQWAAHATDGFAGLTILKMSPEEQEKINEALAVAEAMDEWHRINVLPDGTMA